MKMQHGVKCAALGMTLILTLGARSAVAATYTLECQAMKQGRITAQLSSFQFAISSPRDPQSGLPTGAAHHELIVHMPVQQAYANFLQAMDTNEAISNCKLTETESGGVVVRFGNGAGKPLESLEWTFQNITLANAMATGNDGSGTSGGVPQAGLQVTFNLKSFNLVVKP
jgi:type VI protein secretion system component Hcp